jgi:hypothetical protein
MGQIENKDLVGLPIAENLCTCPKCNHFSYLMKNVLGMTPPAFVEAPDPHLSWKEKYKCPICQTIYVINNQT